MRNQSGLPQKSSIGKTLGGTRVLTTDRDGAAASFASR
jgi:hypothetical protein